MKPANLVAAALILVGLYAVVRPPASDPIPTPDAPDAATQAVVEPISAVLAGHGEQAAELAAFYGAAADVVKRDQTILTTNNQLRTYLERSVQLRFQGAFAQVPGISNAIHGPEGALAKLLGLESGPLDHAKAADALGAVAWACGEAG